MVSNIHSFTQNYSIYFLSLLKEKEWACQVWLVRTGCTVQRQWCKGPQWLLAVAFLNN